MVDIIGQIGAVESGNNRFAKNPRSTATGPHQFIESTFLDMINRYRPDLAQGRSREDILALRTDEDISREMAQNYADQNSAFLRSKGIAPTPGNTYLSHFLGPGGAAAVHANPGDTVRSLLGDQAVAANPFLQGMTGQDVIDWAGRKMTPGQHMAKNIRKRFGTPETPQGGTTVADMDRLKSALSGKTYDPDKLSGADRLIDQGQAIASSSGNPWGAIGGTVLAGLGGYERGQERDSEKAYRTELGQTLSSSENPVEIARTLMTSPDPKLQAAGIKMFSKIKAAASRGGTEDFNKNIVYGVNEKGENVPIQFSDKGRAIQTQLPEGVRIGKNPIRLDAGTHFVLLDPVTRQPVGQIPKDLAGAESEKVRGKTEGEANVDLPRMKETTTRMLKQIEDVRTDPNLPNVTGWEAWLPTLFSSSVDTEEKIRQLSGGAFVQAFQDLKGAGVITEIEGQKATAALARLENMAQSDEGFLNALDDFKREVTRLYRIAQRKAGIPDSQLETLGDGEDDQGFTGGGGNTRLRYNPETGELE